MGGGEEFVVNLVDELVNSVDKTILNDDTVNEEDEIILGGYKYPSLEGHKSFMLTMWVPKDCVGRIIGRKGDVVSKLSRDTHTNIYCDSSNESKSLWTTVCMVGEAMACKNAYQKLAAICDNEVDDCVAEIAIPQSKHPLIIGSKGKTIRRLSADYNVRIFCPDSKLICNSITIEGEFENVFRCHHDMMSIVNISRERIIENSNHNNIDIKEKIEEKDHQVKSKIQKEDPKEVKNIIPHMNTTNGTNENLEDGKRQGEDENEKGKDTGKGKGKSKEKKIKEKGNEKDTKKSNEKTSKEETVIAQNNTQKIREKGNEKDTKKSHEKTHKEETVIAQNNAQDRNVQKEIQDNDNMAVETLKAQVEDLRTQVPPPPPTLPTTAGSETDGASSEPTAEDSNPKSSASNVTKKYTEITPLPFKKDITIPSSIVGLLLVARARPAPSILNQIQRATGTRISLVEPKGDTQGADKSVTDVPFVIQSQLEASIDIAAKAIDDIIKGNRIADVVKGLESHRRKMTIALKKAALKSASKTTTATEGGKNNETKESETNSSKPEDAQDAVGDITASSVEANTIKPANGEKSTVANTKSVKGDKKNKSREKDTKVTTATPKKKQDKSGEEATKDDGNNTKNTPNGAKSEKKGDKRDREKGNKKTPKSDRKGTNSSDPSSIDEQNASSSSSSSPPITADITDKTTSTVSPLKTSSSSTLSSASTIVAAQETAAPSPKPLAATASVSTHVEESTPSIAPAKATRNNSNGTKDNVNGAVEETEKQKDCVLM